MRLIFKEALLDKIRKLTLSVPDPSTIEAIELTESEWQTVRKELRCRGLFEPSDLKLYGYPVRRA